MSNQLAKNELPYWLAYHQIPQLGPVQWQKLLNYFPNLTVAWQASINELTKAGLAPKTAWAIIEKRKNLNPAEELEKILLSKIQVVTLKDDNYPTLLKNIYDPPPLLYYYGRLQIANQLPLAVVGARKISRYGKQVTQNLVGELASNGLTIVSGLALGVDALAHQTTLQVKGRTIAVLGSSLDKIYPATNQPLAKKIIAGGGLVISEFPLTTKPYKNNFPQRNRTIAGLSLGTLVIQASLNSGALITAKFALDQNREVFAVPSNILTPSGQGTNQLIKQGAMLVDSAKDIFAALNLKPQLKIETDKQIPVNQTEKILLEFLKTQPLHVDKLSVLVRLDISVVSATLSLLEIRGLVKNLGGQVYTKI